MSILENDDKQNFKIVLESEDQHYISHQLVQLKSSNSRNQPIAGRFTLIQNLGLETNIILDPIIIKKKVKQLIGQYTSFLMLVNDSIELIQGKLQKSILFIECAAFQLNSVFDQKFEKTLFVIISTNNQQQIKYRMENLRVNNWIIGFNDIQNSLTNLTLFCLKFQIKDIYRIISQEYQKFSTIEQKLKQISGMQSNSEIRIKSFQQTLFQTCLRINLDLDGEYRPINQNYQGFSLKDNIMLMLDTHFIQLKADYVDIINNITYGDIRISLKRQEYITLEGFLTQSQFKAAFHSVIEFLELRSLLILPQINDLIIMTILRQFRNSLEIYTDKFKLQEELQIYLNEIKQICYLLIQQINDSIIHEVYFNADNYQLSQYVIYQLNYKYQKMIIWEVKRIGTIYFRNVILQIQDSVYRLIMSRYVRQIQQTLIKKIYEIQQNGLINSDLDPTYISSLQQDYDQSSNMNSLYREINGNEVFQYYMATQFQDQQKEQIIQIPVKRIRFRDKVRMFFKKKKEQTNKQTDTKIISFGYETKKIHRYYSPENEKSKQSVQKIQRLSTVSEFILSVEKQQDIEPLTIAQWLLISTNDNLFKKISPQKLKVSFAKGIPSGMRSSIWSQYTRIQLLQDQMIKESGGYYKLKDSYDTLKTTQSNMKQQIELDVKRSEIMFARQKEELSDMLKNILIAYSNWDKDLGYTQGMNFITVALLNVYSGLLKNQEFQNYQDLPSLNNREIELNSFLTLVLIMKSRHWEDVLGPKTPQLVHLLYQFELMFKMESFGFTQNIFDNNDIIQILNNDNSLHYIHYDK